MPDNLATNLTNAPLRETLSFQAQAISNNCSRCQRCVTECQFLKKHGDPKQITDNFNLQHKSSLNLAFECSLCGLCSAVCPEKLDPKELFLELRRESVERGLADFPEHKRLLNYERKGTSKNYSWYGLPKGCDTIFFPGCSLPGSRPEQTRKTFELLQAQVPSLGIVLDCCTKPSHDLGREESFQALFGELKQFLQEQGVKTVLVACPNCDLVFSRYAPELTTKTVYEVLDNIARPDHTQTAATVTIHDPCVARFSPRSQTAVRSLVQKSGLQIIETKHTKSNTLCCGEGGAVEAIAPQLASGWGKKRSAETAGHRTITYCSGCANKLGQRGPTNHILDLYFEPEATLADQVNVSRAPLTYWNRLKLKRHLQAYLGTAITRERALTTRREERPVPLKKVLIFLAFITALVVLRLTGAGELLQQDKLRSLIEGYSLLALFI